MSTSWDDRIEQYWQTVDDAQPETALAGMRALFEERDADDAEALYEWASVHDFLGREAEAIHLYEQALSHGLHGARRPQAVIQLASSLRNVGRSAEAVQLLQTSQLLTDDPVTGSSGAAFFALALHDAGRPGEALRVALQALAPTLPLYRGAIARYADDLTD